MKTLSILAQLALLGSVSAFPHYVELLKRETDSYEADVAIIAQMARDPIGALHEHQSREPQLNLPLGGGLLNGILQPLGGMLAGLELPTPQPLGLKEIPGDDPKHQFQKPGKTDVRGICPTMNTLANHGYISRDGITSFGEAANACQIAWGMDYKSTVFLSALGLLARGDLILGKYSIGS